jgi:Ca2+-binding EF-hand superfamily protein
MKNVSIAFLIIFVAITQMFFAQGLKDSEKNIREIYKALLKETDKNKDGKISKVEFYAIWKDKKIAEEKFKAWDVNKDDYITEEEYVKVVMNIGKKK